VDLKIKPKKVLNRGNSALMGFLHLPPVVPALGTTELRLQAAGCSPRLSYTVMVRVG
jgi:hypothetical protein